MAPLACYFGSLMYPLRYMACINKMRESCAVEDGRVTPSCESILHVHTKPAAAEHTGGVIQGGRTMLAFHSNLGTSLRVASLP